MWQAKFVEKNNGADDCNTDENLDQPMDNEEDDYAGDEGEQWQTEGKDDDDDNDDNGSDADTEDNEDYARPDRAEDGEEDDDAGVRRGKGRKAGQQYIDVSLLAQTQTEWTWQNGKQDKATKRFAKSS